MSEFPADWTPEQCAKYRALMESKRPKETVFSGGATRERIKAHTERAKATAKAKAEKPRANRIDLDDLDLDDEPPKQKFETEGEAKQKSEQAKTDSRDDGQQRSTQDEKPGAEDNFEDGRTDEDDGDKPNDPLWKVRLALKHIKPTSTLALRVGRALHSIGDKIAFDVWWQWLEETGVSKESAREEWEKFDAQPLNKPITLGTIYWLADEAGWRRPLVFKASRLDLMVEKAEAIMIRQSADIFQYAGKMVRPVVQEQALSGGKRGNIAQFKEITHSYLLTELARYIDWRKFDKGKNEFVPARPEDRVASAMLSRVGKWNFRRASGVIMAPTLRPDGTLLLEEGYDPATGLILMSPPVMPIIPGKPTREEGLAALTLLDGLLEEVAFVDEPSRSVALSELITPTVRGAFACSPVHATTAATPSSGKTYISDIASAIALGTPGVHPLAAGEKTEEFVKRLNSFLMAGFSYFAIDNMTIPLQGEEFCQAVTAPSYIPRILGKSEIKELPNTWTISANGNNLRVIADMTRRTLMCALDTKMERPELRVFQRNPVNEILAHRGRYIAAVLTVVRAYIAAGKPDQKLTPLNGFDGWTEFVRSALVWLGRVDPAETIETARRTDTELQKRQQVILAIADAFGTGGWVGEGKWPPCARTSAEMVQAATSRIIKTPDGKNPEGEALKHSGPAADALKDAFMLIAIKPNELTPNKISYWFRNNNNKLAMGFRLRSEHDRLKTAHWWIERIAMPETEFDP